MRYELKLERYNHICVSVILTGSIIAAIFGAGALAVSSIFGKKHVAPVNEIQLDKKSSEKTGKYLDIVSSPLAVHGSDFYYSPIYQYSTTKKEDGLGIQNFKSYQGSGQKSYYETDMGNGFWGCHYCRISNILLINRVTSRSQKMFKDSVLIKEFLYPRDNETTDSKTPRDFILYTKVGTDFNKDNKLSRKDGFMLFTCNLNGEDHKAITPENSSYLDFKIDDKNQRFYVRVKVDSNKNGKFDKGDKVELYSSPLDVLTKLELVVW
jgi:hypothetical protein